MALHKHNGTWYCDSSDLRQALSPYALYHQLSRARKRGGGAFQNIVNPYYNRKNSRCWVLLESLPPELRRQLETDLWQASLHQGEALLRLKRDNAPDEEVVAAATQITSEAVLVSLACVASGTGSPPAVDLSSAPGGLLLAGLCLRGSPCATHVPVRGFRLCGSKSPSSGSAPSASRSSICIYEACIRTSWRCCGRWI